MIEDAWDPGHAAELDEPGLLLYRSNLLGGDPRITNFGGGNTSAKLRQKDPLTGEPVTVLWVKGSGGDLGSMERSGFATLYQERLVALEDVYRGLEHEDEMVVHFSRCIFDLNPRAPSIDTPLHAFVPHAHVDHVHPDGVIAIAAARRSRELTREVFGQEVGWLPWQRPGFDLGLRLRQALREQPSLRGVVMAGHGLISWAEDSLTCYRNTLELVNRAEAWLEEHRRRSPAFGGVEVAPLEKEERDARAEEILPILRGAISQESSKVGHFRDTPEVLEFVGSHRMEELAAIGTSCPDHFLRTKIRPLILPSDPDEGFAADLARRLEHYRGEYAAYYDRCKEPDSPAMRGSDPVVYLMPGVGMFTFAADKKTARLASEFFTNAINVMRGASGVDEYVGLDEREAFGIEYWKLEQAKLERLPPPKQMQGRVALIAGGAGGIGQATAERLLADGCCVALVDRNGPGLEEVRHRLAEQHGSDLVHTYQADVTDEAQVDAAFRSAVVELGGVDIIVSNAGIASAAAVEDTTLEQWNRNLDVLGTGCFLVARAAMRLLRRQGIGGSLVFVGSKNSLAASAGASAYCSAKAAAVHLARCLALEGAEEGIRVNVVNPDAVLEGSRIWSTAWRADRAKAYGVAPEELEEYYRKRSLLKRSVRPADVAEAIHFFASDRSSRSTGNIINVDAGNATTFTR